MLGAMSRAPSVLLVTALVAGLAASLAACSKADSKPATKSAPPRGATEAAPAKGAAVMPPEGYAPADDGNAGPDDSFAIEHGAVSGAPGGEQVARIVVTPGKGFHMNKDFPTKVTLELPAGVSSPKTVLLPADAEAFTEDKLAFAVKLTAADKGDFKIPAVVKFAVCTDSTCNPKKKQIELALKAQ